MNNNKKNVLLISAILAIIFSLLFIVIRPVTGIFLISYIFAILGLAILCATTWFVIDRSESYPWTTALPRAAIVYLIIELVLSAVFVLVEQLAKWSFGAIALIEWIEGFRFAPGWYLLIHAVLLLGLIIRIVLLKGGVTHIEKRGTEVKTKTQFIAALRIDAELLANRTENAKLKNQLAKLAETIRFSDPMSADALIPIEQQMTTKMDELKDNLQEFEKASAIADEIALLLEERNAKCKVLK